VIRSNCYEYETDAKGTANLIGELSTDQAQIEWRVDLVNRKAALDHSGNQPKGRLEIYERNRVVSVWLKQEENPDPANTVAGGDSVTAWQTSDLNFVLTGAPRAFSLFPHRPVRRMMQLQEATLSSAAIHSSFQDS
jgi:hypothetical protein